MRIRSDIKSTPTNVNFLFIGILDQIDITPDAKQLMTHTGRWLPLRRQTTCLLILITPRYIRVNIHGDLQLFYNKYVIVFVYNQLLWAPIRVFLRAIKPYM